MSQWPDFRGNYIRINLTPTLENHSLTIASNHSFERQPIPFEDGLLPKDHVFRSKLEHVPFSLQSSYMCDLILGILKWRHFGFRRATMRSCTCVVCTRNKKFSPIFFINSNCQIEGSQSELVWIWRLDDSVERHLYILGSFHSTLLKTFKSFAVTKGLQFPYRISLKNLCLKLFAWSLQVTTLVSQDFSVQPSINESLQPAKGWGIHWRSPRYFKWLQSLVRTMPQHLF